jgi:hypothetical protein
VEVVDRSAAQAHDLSRDREVRAVAAAVAVTVAGQAPPTGTPTPC